MFRFVELIATTISIKGNRYEWKELFTNNMNQCKWTTNLRNIRETHFNQESIQPTKKNSTPTTNFKINNKKPLTLDDKLFPSRNYGSKCSVCYQSILLLLSNVF